MSTSTTVDTMSTEIEDTPTARHLHAVDGRGRRIRYCMVCGRRVKKNIFPKRMKKPLLWCSFRHYREKPEKVIRIEWRFSRGQRTRRDIRDILIETTKGHGGHKAQARTLGISVPYFYTMVDKYFGLEMEDFMIEHAVGERRRFYVERRARDETKRNVQRQRRRKAALDRRAAAAAA